MLQARKRAISVRQKACFGSSQSGYEFGGWKSLLEDYAPSSELKTKSITNADLIRSVKLDSDKNNVARKKIVATETILCPSSQPDIENAVLFGVVEGTIENPRVAYLKRSQLLDPEVQQPSSPVKPTEMLRIASSCQEKKCLHFDNGLYGRSDRSQW